MHALHFVQEFAAFTGQDYATLRVIDRALADAGLRVKAKGKRMPDVTLGEGIMFLLAVLANKQPTHATVAALEIAAFRLLDTRGSRKMVAPLARMIGRPIGEMAELQLVDVLAALCRTFAAAGQPGRWAELSVHRDGPAFLSFGRSADDEGGQLQFSDPDNMRMPKFLTETRTAAPGLLSWIVEKTKVA